MRETINIIKYGFLLFLVLTSIASFIFNNANFNNAINILSIPVFMLSISLLFVKANKLYRTRFILEINNLEKICEQYKIDLENEEKEDEDNNNYREKYIKLVEKCEEYTQYNIKTNNLTFLYKSFFTIDKFTVVFSIISTISFALCLISLLGIININVNVPCINILSLAIMFFDFFMFDDFIKKTIDKKLQKISKKSEKNIKEKKHEI